MQRFEGYVLKHLKKNFPVVKSINNIKNMPDILVCRADYSVLFVEVKASIKDYDFGSHCNKQYDQFWTLDKLPSFIVHCKKGDLKKLKLFDFANRVELCCGDIKDITQTLKEF